MGTTWAVRVVADEDASARLRERVEAELDLVDGLMSTWRPDSELSRLNRFEGPGAFPVSPPTLEVLDLAARVSELSGGAFDVTVGPLVDAWGFGPPGERPEDPGAAELEHLRARVGWRLVELLPEETAVRKARPDVRVDLSAIAKGHAVDRISRALASAGLTDHLVEIGGEVRTSGRGPGGRAWRVGVERPSGGRRIVQSVVQLGDGSLATSGDYRRFREVGGRRLAHALDPRTGRPVEHALASVSVADSTCAVADAWATALLVLGPAEGPRRAEALGLAALFLVREGEGLREVATGEWTRRFGAGGGA
jgi:thiamine biosynthesis lipoprotein